MTYHVPTKEAAKGKWKGVLLQLGIPAAHLTGKHTACPLCGGEDRFRFDNRDGAGTWICNQCGAGAGMDLAQKFTGKEFRDVASLIDGILGNITPDTVRPAMADEDVQRAIREVAALAKPIVAGDHVDRYLTSRGLGEKVYPASLRCVAALRDGEGGVRPAMVASVKDTTGKTVTLHRTFLRSDGVAKAEMASPRKLMPGGLPEGACVRLCDGVPAVLGIAEGVETALAATALYDVPTWAAISAGNLAKWQWPEGVEELAIFGDNDPKFAGQAAAYELARRAAVKGLRVTVHIPSDPGTDFADEYARRRGAA